MSTDSTNKASSHIPTQAAERSVDKKSSQKSIKIFTCFHWPLSLEGKQKVLTTTHSPCCYEVRDRLAFILLDAFMLFELHLDCLFKQDEIFALKPLD